ncbi:hypothetical protein BDR06DRAFT_482868 [Suillus hirtellus]|nr:hypothetical protein BDR06DRAFT_482868 [Suillus hirtellus]
MCYFSGRCARGHKCFTISRIEMDLQFLSLMRAGGRALRWAVMGPLTEARAEQGRKENPQRHQNCLRMKCRLIAELRIIWLHYWMAGWTTKEKGNLKKFIEVRIIQNFGLTLLMLVQTAYSTVAVAGILQIFSFFWLSKLTSTIMNAWSTLP